MVSNFDDDGDNSELDEEGEIEEVVADIEDQCANVLENKENSKLLNEIFELARGNYDKDRKGWETYLADLKFELIATDDEDNIREILAHYLRKAKLELT